MKTIFKKIGIIFAILMIALSNLSSVKVSANDFFDNVNIVLEKSNRTLIYKKGEWTVYYDPHSSGKPYPHLHFYKNKKHFYCLRLDNLQPCDGTKHNKNKVSKSAMKAVMSHRKVQSTLKKYKPSLFSNSVRKKVQPLIVGGAAIGVIVAAANIFAGPIDDIAAWAALTTALGY